MSDAQTIRDRLKKYYAAEASILDGAQKHEIDGEIFTQADLAVITRQINTLQHQLHMATSPTGGIKRYSTVL